MTETELQARLKARGIDWEPPSMNSPPQVFIMGYIDALMAVLDQVEKDYPRLEVVRNPATWATLPPIVREAKLPRDYKK